MYIFVTYAYNDGERCEECEAVRATRPPFRFATPNAVFETREAAGGREDERPWLCELY